MKSSLVLLAGMSAVAPLVGAGIEAPVFAQSATGFAPPSTPMTLSRTVIRELSDGKQIVVTRSFRVQFVAKRNGFTLEGAPVGVTVDVPPVLEPMADLERQRSEPGPFPVQVNSQGLIDDADTGGLPNREARQNAHEVGSNMLRAAPLSEQTRAETLKTLASFVSDPHGSPWPVDLFSAKEPERHLHRNVAMADGSQGEVDVVLRIPKWLPCGMPAMFERVITTDLAGTRRVSREVWRLEPLPTT